MEARGEDEERALRFCDYELQRSPASHPQPFYVRDPSFRDVDLVENGAVSSDRGFPVEEIEMEEGVSRGADPGGASDRRGDLEANSAAVYDYIARSSSTRSGSKAVEMRTTDGEGGDSEVTEARAGSPEWNSAAFQMHDGARHGSQQGTSTVPSPFEIRDGSATRSTSVSEQNRADTAYQMAPPPNPLSVSI